MIDVCILLLSVYLRTSSYDSSNFWIPLLHFDVLSVSGPVSMGTFSITLRRIMSSFFRISRALDSFISHFPANDATVSPLFNLSEISIFFFFD